MATVEQEGQRFRSDSIFFPLMALAIAGIVFIGFSHSFYLKSIYHAPPDLTPLMIVHGVAFTAWIVLLVAQTGLVAGNQRGLHIRLGLAGMALAALMVVLGVWLAVDALRRGFVPPGAPMSPSAFFAVPFFDIVVFAILFVIAFLNRAHPDYHKRFMLLATASMLDVAFGRFPVPIPLPFQYALTDLFIVAVALYDLAKRRRVHPATLWSAVIIIGFQAGRLWFIATPQWHAFTTWLAG